MIDRLVTRVPNAAALKASILAHQTSAAHLVAPDDPDVTDAMWIEAARQDSTVIPGRDLLEISPTTCLV